MADLFEFKGEETRRKTAPLADRLRPENLADFVGQAEIVGEGKILR